MAAELVEPPGSRSFKDASPREIRDALIPEEQADFDLAWRESIAEAGETQDLTGVYRTLAHWRTHAEVTSHLGPHGYRELLARADRIARTGELPPGTASLTEVQAMIKKRLGL